METAVLWTAAPDPASVIKQPTGRSGKQTSNWRKEVGILVVRYAL